MSIDHKKLIGFCAVGTCNAEGRVMWLSNKTDEVRQLDGRLGRGSFLLSFFSGLLAFFGVGPTLRYNLNDSHKVYKT